MSQKPKVVEVPIPEVLPLIGKSRWSGFKRFSPVSLGTFLTLSKQGRAPKAERLGVRCTFYDNAELHKWLSNPAGYVVGQS
nr:transcriptional regulator [uncultured Polynucleobacter sp.]